MKHNIYLYIFITFIVIYLIRVLPLTLIRKKIKNRTLRSFLYYVPYITLAVMVFPGIINASGNPLYGILALVIGILLAWLGAGLFPVAIACSLVVYLCQILPL